MCGIAGIVGNKASEDNLEFMLKALKHRGPDFSDKFITENCVLGHNRLAIIDLTKNANQPFYSNDSRYVLVFNGAIYNYLELKLELKSTYDFKTNSDSEVLLAAYLKWGKDCLKRFNGMFAFAIWDLQKNKLFAARDRFGVKPFYYSKKDNTFFFASEIKALFGNPFPKKPNEKVWANYFLNGSYGMPNETFWDEINQLAGGHYLVLEDNSIEIKKWYFFENEISNKEYSFNEIKEEYSSLLVDAVKLRFRSDVPVGFNISGGLDSSILLGLVNELSSDNIQAFTFYCNNENYDELFWVKELIAQTNNPLNEVLFEAKEVENFSNEISFTQDEPFGGIPTLAYAKIFKEANKNGVKVLLDGQGMDEQWAGYDYYFKNSTSLIQGVSSSPFRKNMFNEKFISVAERIKYPEPFDNKLLNTQYRDLFFTKIPRALRFNDRISMAFATELREPFLDYRLVELAFSQPKEYKVSNGVQKYLLREITKNKLSKKIVNTPKRPLQTPQREWLGDELKSFVNAQIDLLLASKINYWFNKDEVVKEWKLYLNGEQDSSFHIWQLLNTSLIEF